MRQLDWLQRGFWWRIGTDLARRLMNAVFGR